MTTNAENDSDAEPAARPSRPSVRFTALDAPTIMATANTPHPHGPRSMCVDVERVKPKWVLAWTQLTASHANPTATISWPAILPRLLRPRLRCRETLT